MVNEAYEDITLAREAAAAWLGAFEDGEPAGEDFWTLGEHEQMSIEPCQETDCMVYDGPGSRGQYY